MPAVLPTRTFHPDAPGLPLVALHGFLGSKDDWADLAARLPHRRIVAVDLPGHGEAVGLDVAAYGFDEAVAALSTTLASLEYGRFDLLGYSMGGRVALAFALAHPSFVNTLTLESSSPGLSSEEERAARRALDAERADALRRDFPAFLRDWYAMPLFATLTAAQRDALIAQRATADPDELARGLVGMGTGAMPNLWPALSALTVPVRLVAGARDAKFAALAGRMAERLPCASVHLVGSAGHNVHLEQPEAFAALVQR
ncbi:MAG: 2-succinyl-6-hydroxy-2,4-cyclohexadiene-1-carboxylate synthase [Rhodothermales bacterium]|nr:2-succinyl-6-hydroxy-2,4-cyclohexadiene-1-carboxylate synthase [Rhodothermales bacterium]